MRSRVCTRALHGVCTGRKRTYVQKESRELGRETKTERERRKRGRQGDGSCVCTTRRVYQATSVVTAIVPTTSPAGRHPRSILSLSSFPSRPPWSLTSCRIPSSFSGALGVFFLAGEGGQPSYPTLLSSPSFSCVFASSFLLPFSSFLLSIFGEINKDYFRAKSKFLVTSSLRGKPVYHFDLSRNVIKCVPDLVTTRVRVQVLRKCMPRAVATSLPTAWVRMRFAS